MSVKLNDINVSYATLASSVWTLSLSVICGFERIHSHMS